MSTSPTARTPYFVIDYTPGPAAPTSAPDPADPAVVVLRAHLEHLRAGHQAGFVVLAGPWTGQLASGLVIVNGDHGQVDQFIADDPAVQQSVLVPTVHRWSPLVGLPRTSPTDGP